MSIFDQLLSTQNVNLARFTRNFECDFSCYFQTLCTISCLQLSLKKSGHPKAYSHQKGIFKEKIYTQAKFAEFHTSFHLKEMWETVKSLPHASPLLLEAFFLAFLYITELGIARGRKSSSKLFLSLQFSLE